MKIIDQSQDLNGQETHRLLQIYSPPKYVKESSLDSRCGGDELQAAGFARPWRREYPQHTPQAVWLSAAFFFDKQASAPDEDAANVEANLRRAATYFGILPDIDKLSQQVKTAHVSDIESLPDEMFGLVLVNADTRRRMYPLRNSKEVTKAAEYFKRSRSEFNSQDRRTFATKILHRAQAVGASLGDTLDLLCKSAGHGAAPVEEIAHAIRVRAHAIATLINDGEPEELLKLASHVEKHASDLYHYDTMVNIVDTLDVIDRKFALRLDLPEDAVFGITEKKANDLLDSLVTLLSGNAYRRGDLAGLSLEKLADYFGDSFVSEVSAANALLDIEKLASVLHTLPLDDAELFDRLAADSGIRPAARKMAADRPQPLTEAMQQQRSRSRTRGRLWSLAVE